MHARMTPSHGTLRVSPRLTQKIIIARPVKIIPLATRLNLIALS
jgi:hypothetical protein